MQCMLMMYVDDAMYALKSACFLVVHPTCLLPAEQDSKASIFDLKYNLTISLCILQ